MTRWVGVVTFAPDAGDDAVDRWLGEVAGLAGRAAGVVCSAAGRHLPVSRGPGDATWDVTTDTGTGPPEPGGGPVAGCLWAALTPVAAHVERLDGPRVKRTLLLRVRPATPDDEVRRFEAALAAMPEHVRTIRSWALSRVDPAASTGAWTHAWEQEFADLDGLTRDYMHHPYHWTGVERWFDPEIPGSIVEADLAHLVREAPGPVLGRT